MTLILEFIIMFLLLEEKAPTWCFVLLVISIAISIFKIWFTSEAFNRKMEKIIEAEENEDGGNE